MFTNVSCLLFVFSLFFFFHRCLISASVFRKLFQGTCAAKRNKTKLENNFHLSSPSQPMTASAPLQKFSSSHTWQLTFCTAVRVGSILHPTSVAFTSPKKHPRTIFRTPFSKEIKYFVSLLSGILQINTRFLVIQVFMFLYVLFLNRTIKKISKTLDKITGKSMTILKIRSQLFL